MERRSYLRSILLPEEGWLSFIFLCGVALSSVWSLYSAGWVENLEVLPWLTILAVLAGFLLAKVRLPGLLLHLVGLITGLVVVVYAVASTLSGGSAKANAVELWDRLEHWVNVLATGGISTDNLLFLLLLSAIIWLMGYYGAWSVFRSRGPWWVILTSGSVLVVNLSYARNLDWFALLYLLSSMLLVVRLNVAVQEDFWRRSGVEYSSEFTWQLVRTSVIIAVVVVLVTWAAPSSAASQQLTDAWAKVSGPWQNAEAEFTRLFGGLRVRDQSNASGFGKTLALRGATALGDTAVLAVSATEAPYLRGIVYERYTGQGWLAPERTAEQILPNDPRLSVTDGLQERIEVTTTIKVLQPRGMTVLAPPQPLRISVPASAEFASGGEPGAGSDQEAAYADVSILRSAMLLRRGQQYAAVSSVSRADVKSLRSAGTRYPDWVKQHYLSLPRGVPNRVITLARRTTRGLDNPYDKAVAIQNFLRTYPYSEVVPAPPSGRDVVDFFLFESRIGYCDYYASAMAVMLRSIGIPARIVSGYSPGEYDATEQAFIVRDANAHSWPEVYFPGLGWVEFEPTASRPAPVFPEEPSSVVAPQTAVDPQDSVNPDIPLDELDPKEHPSTPHPTALAGDHPLVAVGRYVGLALAVALAAYLALLFLWRRAFRGLAAPEAAYAKMSRVAQMVGAGRRPSQTPFEHGRRLASLLPRGRNDIHFIVEQYVRQRFGRKTATPSEEARLTEAWRRLRGHLAALVWRRLPLQRIRSRR